LENLTGKVPNIGNFVAAHEGRGRRPHPQVPITVNF
jgi:hypothetical protein